MPFEIERPIAVSIDFMTRAENTDEEVSLIQLGDKTPPNQSSKVSTVDEQEPNTLEEFDLLHMDTNNGPQKGSYSEDLLEIQISTGGGIGVSGNQAISDDQNGHEITDNEGQGFGDEGFDESEHAAEASNSSTASEDTENANGNSDNEPEVIHIIALEVSSGESYASPPEYVVDANRPQAVELEIISRDQIPEACRKVGKEDFMPWHTLPTRGTISVENTTLQEFQICNVNGPGRFYLQNTTELRALKKLEAEMTDWYNEYFWEKHLTLSSPEQVQEGNRSGKRSFEHMRIPVEDGGFYAAFIRDTKKWVRCTAEKVDGFGAGQDILIHLIDHGTQGFVAEHMVLPLRPSYLQLPIQSYRGKLYGVDLADVPPAGIKKFRESTEGQRFMVLIMESEQKLDSVNIDLGVVILAKVDMWGGEMPFTGFPAPSFKRTQGNQ